MQDLQRWLPFDPLVPSELGPPDAVYLRILENGSPLGMLAWKYSGELPETAETGLGAWAEETCRVPTKKRSAARQRKVREVGNFIRSRKGVGMGRKAGVTSMRFPPD